MILLQGYDIKKKQSTKYGGIFGQVRAFAGSTETQGTGNLHFHFLLWINGWPKTIPLMEKYINHKILGRKYYILFIIII